MRLQAIIDALGGELLGDPSITVERLSTLSDADPSSLSFLSSARYLEQLRTCRAACVVVAPANRQVAMDRGACIVTEDPYLYFARLTQWWRQTLDLSRTVGIHPSAVVDPDAFVDPSASVGALSVVEAGARIGPDSRIGARVVVGSGCVLGARCIVHPGVVIGADGFGFAPSPEGWVKIEQLGVVRIGDDVEIGANTCIDRGALGDTVIGDGVKLDNLIQIGHNVRIGAHTAMAGCVGVAGSAVIGARCTVGGGAVILGHLELVDGVHVSAASVVTRSLLKPGQYTGVYPIEENAAWEKNASTLRQLRSLRDRIRALEARNNKQDPNTP